MELKNDYAYITGRSLHCGVSRRPAFVRGSRVDCPIAYNSFGTTSIFEEHGMATELLFYPVWQSVARRSRYTKEVIAPSECLTREQALRAATMNGAWLTFDEKRKGSLEPGKLADLAVLDADPLAIEEEDIKTIAAEMTIVGGKIVYERKPGEDPAAGLVGL